MSLAPTPQARHLVPMSIGLFLFYLRNTFQLGDRSYCCRNIFRKCNIFPIACLTCVPLDPQCQCWGLPFLLLCIFAISLESISQVEELDIANFEIGGAGVSHLLFPTSRYLTKCCFLYVSISTCEILSDNCLQNWDFLCSVSLRLQTTFRRSSAEKTRMGIPDNIERKKMSFAQTPAIEIGAGGCACWEE